MYTFTLIFNQIIDNISIMDFNSNKCDNNFTQYVRNLLPNYQS